MSRVVPCPACGLNVVMDPDNNTIRHQAPMCDEFVRRVKAAGLEAQRDEWAVVVNPMTGQVKEPGQA